MVDINKLRILKNRIFPKNAGKSRQQPIAFCKGLCYNIYGKQVETTAMLRVSADRRTDSLPCVPDGSRRRAGEQCKEEEL